MTPPKPASPAKAELRGHPVLGALSDELLARVLAGTRVVRLRQGESLFRQGEPADRFYLDAAATSSCSGSRRTATRRSSISPARARASPSRYGRP